MDKTQAQATLELRDIHLGEANFWPMAPGWWMLLLLFLVVLYFVFKKLAKIRKQKQLNQLMQQELKIINSDFKKHQNKNKLAADISVLLKRFVRFVLNDSHSTSLTGKQWIDYLNDKADTDVLTEFRYELTQAQYLPHCDFDTSKFIATIKSYFPQAINAHAKGAKDV